MKSEKHNNSENTEAGYRKAKILIVDDNEASRYSLEKILSYSGYEIISAGNGRDALQRFHKDKPDLLITDMDMPLMNGFELAIEIRRDTEFSHIPIIFISAMYKDLTSKVIAMEIGGNDYITQPVDSDELLFKVKAMLRTKKLYDDLHTAEEEWEKTFNTIPDLILVIDNDYRITRANKAIAERVGLSREDLIGRLCYEIFHGSDKPSTYCPHEKTIKDGKEQVEEVYEKHLDGFFLLSATPLLDADGRTIGIVEVARDITKRKELEEQLQEMAVTDDLTRLLNRRGFFSLAEQQCKIADRTKRGISLLYADLNNLKQINDRLGHKAGDQALIDTARVLKKTFRESDIIARIGGDEFAILLTELSEDDIEPAVTKHLKDNLDTYNASSGQDFQLSLSTGIAYFNPEHPCTVSDLVIRADTAMYKAKKHSKSEAQKNESVINNKTERRINKRFRTDNKFFAQLTDSDGIIIKDISVCGICVKSSEYLNASRIYNVKLNSHEGHIKAKSIVVWSYLIGPKDVHGKNIPCYETGLKFIDPDDMTKEALEKYISSLNQ